MMLREDAVRISLFGTEMYPYGLCCAIGAACALAAAGVVCRVRKTKPGTASLACLLCLALGIVCSRLAFCLLDQEFGMDILNAPVITYAALGVAFGLFKMFTHVLRGFSVRSLLVDALCTLLSLPLMFAFHHILLYGAEMMGHEATLLVPFTVFVVKLASDTAVGIADGMADRERNLRLRMNDYHARLNSALALYSRLEAMFPENNVLNMLDHPAALLDKLEQRDPQFRLALIINALDLMYFWFYQPRANYALKRHLRRFSPGERIVLLRMQGVLRLEKQISQLLVHGLLGDSFASPLSFYVTNCENYLRQMNETCLDLKAD